MGYWSGEPGKVFTHTTYVVVHLDGWPDKTYAFGPATVPLGSGGTASVTHAAMGYAGMDATFTCSASGSYV